MTTTITATVSPTTVTAEIGAGSSAGAGGTNVPLYADILVRSAGFDPEVGTFTEVVQVGPLGDEGNRIATQLRATLVGYTVAVIDTGKRWTITASGPCTEEIAPKGGQPVFIGAPGSGGLLEMIGANGAYITDDTADATSLVVASRAAYARRLETYVTAVADGEGAADSIEVDPNAEVFVGGAYDGLPIYRIAGYTPGDGGVCVFGDGNFTDPNTVVYLVNQLTPALNGVWELFTDAAGDYGTAGDVYLVRTVIWNSTLDNDSTSPFYAATGNVFINDSQGADHGLWHTEADGLHADASAVLIARIWENHWNASSAAAAGPGTLGDWLTSSYDVPSRSSLVQIDTAMSGNLSGDLTVDDALATIDGLSLGGSVATDAIFDAKGDLPVGTGANTAAKLTAGANDTFLVADSGQATGLKWATPSTARTALSLVPGTDVQAYDADLAAIAALSPTNDDVVQRKSGAWTNRTMAQLWADLNTSTVTGSGTVYRTSNSTAKNNDTTVATDSVLQFTGAANTDYEIRCTMFVTSNATADFKVALTAPTGATFMCAVMGTGTGGSAIPGNHQQLGFLNATTDEVAAGCVTGGDGVMVEVRGIVRVSSTSGTVGIQWAQNTATVVDTIVQSMSFLNYRKIS